LSIPLEASRTGFPALEKEIAISLHSRRQFVHAKVIYENPEMFDRVKRAWAVWMMANSSYGCMLDSSFGYDRTGSTSMKLDNKRETFTIDCAIRLQRTQIECCDALRVIRSRDVPDAFFYLDPPYVGSDQGHYDGYTQEDFDALLELLETIKGKFLLSHFRNKSLAEFSKRNGWETVEYSLPLTMTHGAKIVKRKVEVLTANYPIREKALASGRKAM